MKILHVSRSDLHGGASVAAFRLHSALRERWVDSWMFVEEKASLDERVVAYQPSKLPLARIKRRLQRISIRKSMEVYSGTRPPNLDLFSHYKSPYGNSVSKQFPPFDILHLHWISSFVDVQLLLKNIGERTPVIWTLHDMNPFTGGCHFDMGCGLYRTKCGSCPQLGSKQGLDLSSEVFEYKLGAYAALESGQLQLVAPSRWLATVASQSALMDGCQTSVIPYSVDARVFQRTDQSRMRKKLSIPESSKVVLFVAEMTWNHRKGLDLLVSALGQVRDLGNVVVVTVGAGSTQIPDFVRSINLGRLNSATEMADAFSMADIFVAPSREDNLPNAVLEAMACGTAVVAFDIGGMPDLIRHGESGLLAKAFDPSELGAAIEQLLRSDDLRQSFGRRARELALSEFAPDEQARRYAEIYDVAWRGRKQ